MEIVREIDRTCDTHRERGVDMGTEWEKER